ncbi:SANT/Myb domain [Phytophthora cinnamomi]|uniref:SANT/Myb domain n=1 Tax=Phytophthora cinnamomi TaxID=4785 RepID=UPI00355A9225|nr:SANT/Myb domain [Phytophthora cinnamomi]
MRAALEACGEFLARIGALEGANAVADILRKTGQELSEASAFRWRALLAAVRQELEAEPLDAAFLFERLLQLDAGLPSRPGRALLGSPLFLHLLVERFAAAFEGLDAELFKLESDELCHAEGIFETCVLIRDRLAGDDQETELKTFLAAFERIFEQDEPKECWDAFYELYRLNDATFRRDMKRALCLIESVALGPTKLEVAFPTEAANGPKKIVPRALLEKRFGGTRREWRDLSQIHSIGGADINQASSEEQVQETQHLVNNANGETPESISSDSSEETPAQQRIVVSSRPPRAEQVARTSRQENRRSVARPRTPTERSDTNNSWPIGRRPPRRKSVRWSAEEEAALIEGYRLYETYSNVWVLIKTKYPNVLHNRSNVDLKDKYRNLVRYGKIPRVDGDGTDNAGVTDNDGTDDNGNAETQTGANDPVAI